MERLMKLLQEIQDKLIAVQQEQIKSLRKMNDALQENINLYERVEHLLQAQHEEEIKHLRSSIDHVRNISSELLHKYSGYPLPSEVRGGLSDIRSVADLTLATSKGGKE